MSYMSDKAILKEGIIDSVLKTIFSSKNKKKSKKIEKQVKKLNNALADFEKAANARDQIKFLKEKIYGANIQDKIK